MLVSRLKGGLGNQMFQYAAARALGIRSGRELGIDALTGFESDGYGRQYALGDFAVSAPVLAPQEVKRAAAHARLRTVLIRELEGVSKNCFGRGHVGALLRLIPPGEAYLDGYWQSEKYFADSAAVIRSEFTCTRRLCDADRSVLNRIRANESVSVHVRRRGYPVLCSAGYYGAATQLVCRRIAHPEFLFFGDDRVWIDNLIAGLRLPFPCAVVQSRESDVGEFELMRACRHHIIANSTFSWWAAWLSESAGSVIVAPAAGWSGRRKMVTDVVPDRWIALPDSSR
jgi:hypothetical protein